MKRPELIIAALFVAALSLGCPGKETPTPTPEPTPVVEPTAPPAAVICRRTEMISGAPVTYCFEVGMGDETTPTKCPEGAALNDVPFCR